LNGTASLENLVLPSRRNEGISRWFLGRRIETASVQLTDFSPAEPRESRNRKNTEVLLLATIRNGPRLEAALAREAEDHESYSDSEQQQRRG